MLLNFMMLLLCFDVLVKIIYGILLVFSLIFEWFLLLDDLVNLVLFNDF